MKRVVFSVVILVAALLPGREAVAAPSIAFVNPSGYTAPPPKISDVQDADGFVHLVAWAKEIPPSALVEFELQPQGQNAATFLGEPVTADTWEKLIPLPDQFPDAATYTLRVRLYRGEPGNADEVANAEMTVEVNQSDVPPPRGETVELTYPDNGDRLGIFVPKGQQPVGVFDYAASVDTERVRAFYTVAAPGSVPAWLDCGSSVPDDQGFGKVRCTLEEGHGPLDVTAVAVVSNKTTPPAPPSAALDDTGDAHRVEPYVQVPSSVAVSGGSRTVDLAACHMMTASVSDQFDRPVAAANLDVHAEGPEDALVFGSSENQTDGFQAPDEGHASRENAKRCSDNDNSGQQGDHNSPARDDVKHIESTEGTSNNGGFRFALRSDFAGGTFVQAWADADDDDLPDLPEASGGTELGWGTPPPQPNVEVFLTPASTSGATGSCVELEIVARRSGGPFSNANVDIHLDGPDPSVSFCSVEGGGLVRAPESGGHVGSSHDDGTRHGEGETQSSGRFLFGVTSASEGVTDVRVWADGTDDDLLSGEPSKAGTVTWSPPGDRTISISSSKSTVGRGRRVRLTGAIDGDPACVGGQVVNIQSKPVRGGRFGIVKRVTTDPDGDYATRIRMRSSRKFRAVAPRSNACELARSRTVTVRVR